MLSSDLTIGIGIREKQRTTEGTDHRYRSVDEIELSLPLRIGDAG